MATTKTCFFFLIFFSAVFIIYAQQSPTHYAFLTKLNKSGVISWAQSKSKKELFGASDYLIWQAEKEINESNIEVGTRLLQSSLLIAEFSKDSFALGKINFLLGKSLIELKGESANQVALNNFEKAKEYLSKLNTPDSKILLGTVLLEIANILIRSPDRIDKSDAFLNISTSYSLAIETSSNRLLGITYENFGVYYFYQEEYAKSLAFFEKAESLLISTSDFDSLLELNAFSTYLFNNLSIRGQAIEQEERGGVLLTRSNSKRKKMLYLRAKATLLNSSGDALGAIAYFRLAQKMANELGATDKALSFQYTIGKTFQWEGDYLNAEIELRKVIDIAEKSLNQNEELIRASKIGLAATFEGQGKISLAQELFEKIGKNLGNDSNTKYNYYLHRAKFLISQNDLKSAGKLLDLAKNETKSPISTTHLNFLKLFVDYKTKEISPDQTIQKLNEPIAKIKDEQLNTRNIGINLNYLDEFIFPFHFKTLVQIEKGDFEEALLDSDSYKSRWLTSKMVSDKAFGTVNKSWIVSDEAKELRTRIFQRLLVSLPNREQKADIELQNLLKTHEEKLNLRQDVSSLTEKLKKTEFSKPELKDLTSKLSENVILEYSFTNEFLTTFVIRQNQPVKVFNINIEERILKEKIEKWRGEIVGQDLGFKKESHELYDLLIKPIESEIKNASGLIIIPEGILWKLPFQALLNSQQKYLIEQTPISYVPSLKVLQTLQTRKFTKTNSALNVAGFGNASSNSAKALPDSETEIKNLMSVYPAGSFLFREKATETALKIAMENADIIHLAVHGKLDELQPMRSSIILAKDALNDGDLEIEEIIGLKKSPEVVVLSACSTSDGQVFNGEGLLSLTWAFIAAGSRNVVATQWEIDDTATSEQMLSFHQQLSKNVSVAKSLRFAVLKQIEKKGIQNHPYYWAGFVSVGGF